jgi:hypothetical protein
MAGSSDVSRELLTLVGHDGVGDEIKIAIRAVRGRTLLQVRVAGESFRIRRTALYARVRKRQAAFCSHQREKAR